MPEATTGLFTPTGRLVYDGDPHTDAWFAARREGITGTDLPKILGLSKYGNALSVWRDKRGERADEAGEEAYWGTVQEPIIADRWADLEGTTVAKVGIVAHGNQPWLRASLDRLVNLCPDSGEYGVCGLEIKTRNAYVAGKWKEDVPDDVLAQVQWGLMATGFDHMHVACLIGGQKLQRYVIGRDAKLEDYLIAAARPVWECVEKGHPPNVDADSAGVLLAELNQMYADRAGAVHVDLRAARAYLNTYAQGHRWASNGKAIKEQAKGNLVKLLGEAEVALDNNDEPLYSYKRPEATQEMTAKQISRLKREHPKIYSALVAHEFITTTTPNPRINIK